MRSHWFGTSSDSLNSPFNLQEYFLILNLYRRNASDHALYELSTHDAFKLPESFKHIVTVHVLPRYVGEWKVRMLLRLNFLTSFIHVNSLVVACIILRNKVCSKV